MKFITLPKATRGFLNVGTGEGGELGRLTGKLIGSISKVKNINGSIKRSKKIIGNINRIKLIGSISKK